MHLNSADPLNTLKVTTQVFSVLVFLCFFKIQRRLWPRFLDVSRTTFGMYLSHVIVLAAFLHPLWTILQKPGQHPLLGSFAMRVAMWLGAALLTVATSFLVARVLSTSPGLSWTVGIVPARARTEEFHAEAIPVAVVG